ncbi:MAG TPA: ribonuclease H-like domain-containing protein [Candidatus Paceibacterota bacterium]|nr:ribonuclease H-like domain-containing protein [Candidatus Paceibacterota bacterium]
MKKDTIVIDIETKNTFFDVGRDNFSGLEISLIGLYSYNNDKYIAFDEHQFSEAGEYLKNSDLIVGFAITRFDLPVMAKHYDFDLFSIPRIDILDEIELMTGKRIGLDMLAQANIGMGKTGHGLEAATLYKEGKIDELKSYCLNDVKITKELYDLAKNQGHLVVPQRNQIEPVKVSFDWSEKLLYQRLF